MVKNKDLILYGAVAAGLFLLSKQKQSVTGINGESSSSRYYERNLDKLSDPGGYVDYLTIKLSSSTGSTNHINVTPEFMAALNSWYRKNKKNIR